MCESSEQRRLGQGTVLPLPIPSSSHGLEPLLGLGSQENREGSGRRKYFFFGIILGSKEERSSLPASMHN